MRTVVHQRTMIVLLALVACALFCAPAAVAQETINRESQLKAGYLFYFGHYVQWPEKAFPHSDKQFVIGVLGQNTLGSHLRALTRTKVKDKPVVVQMYEGKADYQPCEILFVSSQPVPGDKRSHAQRLADAATLIGKQPVLLVSEIGGEEGPTISFVVDLVANRIVLDIDIVAAKGLGLTINSRLLDLQHNGVVRIVRRGT